MRKRERTVTSSLNVRLVNSILIFALVIIAAFTTIQVRSQMAIATSQNLYLSKFSVIIIQKSIRQAIDQSALKGGGRDTFKRELQKTLEGLVRSKTSKEIFVADKEGKLIAQSAADGKQVQPALEDLERVQNIIDFNTQTEDSYSFLNRPKNALDTLMPIAIDNKVAYVLKTSYSLGNLEEVLKTIYIPIIITVCLIILLSAISAISLSNKIVAPIKTLNKASKQIASGDLGLHVNIETNDEIEELAQTFNQMTRQLVRMKEIAENANPLTKLPGNTMIRELIEKRIAEQKKFVVIHSDLDHFKVYNDAYGIGAGDNAIKLTADIFREAIKKFGGPEDFLGHEGGDDFVLLIIPRHTKEITDYSLAEFDKRSKDLYSKEDLARGFIMGRERRFEEKGSEADEGPMIPFPLISISLAGLSNEERPFESYADVTNRITDAKHRAKHTRGSCFILAK